METGNKLQCLLFLTLVLNCSVIRYGTAEMFDLYKQDYVELYVKTIRKIVQEEDPFRPFIVSSPTNGRQSEEDGYVAKNPYSPLYGDSKVFNYLGKDCAEPLLVDSSFL